MKLQFKGPIHYLILKASLLYGYNKVASVTTERSVAPHSSLEHIDLPYLKSAITFFFTIHHRKSKISEIP
jgi:hypothetical protein